MEIIKGKAGTEMILVRFDPGEDLLEGLKSLIRAEGIKAGVVLSGIGCLSQCRFHQCNGGEPPDLTARRQDYVELTGTWELASLQGIIADGELHLHMTVGEKDRTYAGHVEKGNIVFTLAEVSILVIDAPIKRQLQRAEKIKQLIEVQTVKSQKS